MKKLLPYSILAMLLNLTLSGVSFADYKYDVEGRDSNGDYVCGEVKFKEYLLGESDRETNTTLYMLDGNAIEERHNVRVYWIDYGKFSGIDSKGITYNLVVDHSPEPLKCSTKWLLDNENQKRTNNALRAKTIGSIMEKFSNLTSQGLTPEKARSQIVTSLQKTDFQGFNSSQELYRTIDVIYEMYKNME